MSDRKADKWHAILTIAGLAFSGTAGTAWYGADSEVERLERVQAAHLETLEAVAEGYQRDRDYWRDRALSGLSAPAAHRAAVKAPNADDLLKEKSPVAFEAVQRKLQK